MEGEWDRSLALRKSRCGGGGREASLRAGTGGEDQEASLRAGTAEGLLGRRSQPSQGRRPRAQAEAWVRDEGKEHIEAGAGEKEAEGGAVIAVQEPAEGGQRLRESEFRMCQTLRE